MRQIAVPSAALRARGTGFVPGRRKMLGTLFVRRISIVGGVVSFEAFFLLFIFAGVYKEMPELEGFPVDFTLAFLVLSMLVGVWVLFRRPCSVRGVNDISVILYCLFLSWVAWSLVWSPMGEFNLEKLSKTTILISWCFFGGCLIVGQQQHRVIRFVVIVMIIAVALLLYLWYYRFILGKIDPETGATKGTNYLQYGLQAQYLLAILVCVVVAGKGFVRPLLGALGAITVLVFMLFIGARGPLLWAIFSVALAPLFLLLNPNARSYRTGVLSLVVWPIIVLGLSTLVLMWTGTAPIEQLVPQMRTLERFEAYSEWGGGSSVRGRTEAQLFALEWWSHAPIIGWGVGAFEQRYLENLRYPHNLFLEVLMEQGLIGFGLLAALMGLGLVRAWKLWPADRSQWPAMALILMFVALLMSRATHQGFLPDERPLFAFLGVILGLGQRRVDRSGMREQGIRSKASASGGNER
jgi:O-antigen ligase